MYTQLCRELASAGAIVIALEHEDGSGIVAYDEATGKVIDYVEQPEWPYDTVAFNRPFLERRAREVEQTIAGLRAAAPAAAVAEGWDAEAVADAPAASAAEVALAAVLREGDPERLVLAGHSFGAASVLHYLLAASPPRDVEGPAASPIRGALLLDLWPAPLSSDISGVDLQRIGARLRAPFVLLLSEFWEGLEWYSPSCRRLALGAGPRCLAAGVVRGAFHHWVSDSHLWAPAWALRLLKLMGPGEYRRVHLATVRALHASFRAMLEPATEPAPQPAAATAGQQLRSRWASLDPEVLELLG